MYEYYEQFLAFYKSLAPKSISTNKFAIICFLIIAQLLVAITVKIAQLLIMKEKDLEKRIKYLCWFSTSFIIGLIILFSENKSIELKTLPLYSFIAIFFFALQKVSIYFLRKKKDMSN
ncbi:hypothetical protein [Halobacteriovorax sp. HLS]|uniref:hypothetical protein n=1 Tax=Halobacteriovorax sp. HLS TaxID=2234000 RepID=UPI000FDB1B45|nr:hypothetical protein [Halobacteriovorax sp. HLS]